MPRLLVVLAGILLLIQAGIARQIVEICGTNPERRKEELYLHRQAELARRAARMQSAGAQSGTPRAASHDVGNIVVLEDSDGVVSRRNPFNLNVVTHLSEGRPVRRLVRRQSSIDRVDAERE